MKVLLLMLIAVSKSFRAIDDDGVCKLNLPDKL